MARSAPAPGGNPPASGRGNAPVILLTALVTAILTGALALWLNRPKPQPIAIHPPPAQEVAPALQVSPTAATVVVFVSGAVRSPGNYTLPSDARVADALQAAGGFAEGANVNTVNQAEHVRDEAQIYVPALTDAAGGAPPAGISGGAGDLGGTKGGSVIDLGAALVNLNSATQEQLESLPGIGPEKAKAIIAGRPYASIEDLLRVDGIGDATLKKLRELISAQ